GLLHMAVNVAIGMAAGALGSAAAAYIKEKAGPVNPHVLAGIRDGIKTAYKGSQSMTPSSRIGGQGSLTRSAQEGVSDARTNATRKVRKVNFSNTPKS